LNGGQAVTELAAGAGVETISLGGGCFWCLEAVFERMQGVERVEPGYMGGRHPHPTYEEVCGGATGHVEVVRVVYDPVQTSLAEILEVFFVVHDPTTPNRQGNDVGTQYRSAIFCHGPEQEVVARHVMSRVAAAGLWPDPLVTDVQVGATFYPAEEYHREYFRRNPYQPYCQFVVGPKVAKFSKHFAGKLKPQG